MATIIRTKIICTLGPAVNSHEKICQLIECGMNVARINFSHGSHEEHLKVINMVKAAREEMKQPVAIMLDTKGPEIRLGIVKNGSAILKKGQQWQLVKEVIEGDEVSISINPGSVLNDLKGDETILFDDGYIVSKVVKIDKEGVTVEILNDGIIRSKKGVNIPNAILNLPAVTETDIADIRFGCQQDVDIIAASFIRSADHVLEIKKLLANENKADTLVLAKIENAEGVHNFDTIVHVADGIMIARGDLGVEVPLSQVPGLQKMMIRKCYLAGKPAVTATQMLESMIQNPRPTRAEVSDVANAIYDSSSAVMLSGETAVGKYPLEVVRVMKSIIVEAEKDFQYQEFFEHHARIVYHDVPSTITVATVKAGYTSGARAIFTSTSGGTTARLLSRLRPEMPIIAMTPHKKSYYQMAINWGVIPVLGKECHNLLEAFADMSSYALEHGLISYGDQVVVTAGSPFGISGTTNMLLIENIGEVLVRAHIGFGNKIHGNIVFVLSPDSVKLQSVRDKLLVITKYDDSYFPFVQESLGVILQNDVDDIASERKLSALAKTTDKTILIRADGACRILKEGQLVTIDPERAVVYKG